MGSVWLRSVSMKSRPCCTVLVLFKLLISSSISHLTTLALSFLDVSCGAGFQVSILPWWRASLNFPTCMSLWNPSAIFQVSGGCRPSVGAILAVFAAGWLLLLVFGLVAFHLIGFLEFKCIWLSLIQLLCLYTL